MAELVNQYEEYRNISLSGASDHTMLGVRDDSLIRPKRIASGKPQHLPLIHTFAPKGDTGREQLDGPAFIAKHGIKMLDRRGKFYNPQVLMLETIFGRASEVIVKKLDPVDSEFARATLYADVLVTDKVVIDNTGATVTIQMLDIKYVTSNELASQLDVNDEFVVKIKEGTMTNNLGVKSTIYPIMSIEANSRGTGGNDIGYGLNPIIGFSTDAEEAAAGKLIYGVSKYERTEIGYRVDPTIMDDQYAKFTFVKDSVNKYNKPNAFEDIVPSKWFNAATPFDEPLTFADVKEPVMHYGSIEELKLLIATNEEIALTVLPVEVRDAGDFSLSSAVTILNMINILTFKDTKEVTYAGCRKALSESTLPVGFTVVDMSKNTPFFMVDGLDGDVSFENLQTHIRVEMEDYLNPDAYVHNVPTNRDSIIYDPGFSLDTKYALINYIGLRKDSFVMLSTYIFNVENRVPLLDEEATIASLLMTRLRLMPESTYFGTPVMRGSVVVDSGFLADDTYKYRVPAIFEVANMMVNYMGAVNGKWKGVHRFDRGELRTVEKMKGFAHTELSDTARRSLHIRGCIWVEGLADRGSYKMSPMQTVYDYDSSILNHVFTAMAVVTLNKKADEVFQEMEGSVSLTDNAFASMFVEKFRRKVDGIFDDIFVVKSAVIYTEQDKDLGYSWNFAVELYANIMKTVMVSRIVGKRMTDLIK